MKKVLFFLILIFILVGICIGFSKLKIDEDYTAQEEIIEVSDIYIDELNIPVSNVDTFNPLRTKNSDVLEIMKLVYEPLFDFQSDDDLEYVLALEYAKLDDKTWIVKLNENVYFHGGEKLSADDVIFTIDKLQKEDLVYSDNVKNISEVQRLDDYAIKIYLYDDDSFLISKLTFPIIPKYYFNGDSFENEEKAKRMVGTGPYMYDSKQEFGFKLVFNNNWHESSSSKLKKINIYIYDTYGEAIKAFKSSQIDIICTNMTNWKDKFGTIGSNSYSFENSEYEVIIPNFNNNLLSNKSVRRALLQGINRENIINFVYNDNASISDLPFHINSKQNISNYEYDVEKAKQILINDGWNDDNGIWEKDNQVLSFKLLVEKENEEKNAVASIIKENLEELGIIMYIESISKSELIKRINNDNFELALVSFDIKNEFIISDFVLEEGLFNYANYKSNNINEIIYKLKQSEDYYKENINEFIQELKNEAPYIGLYFKTSTILTNKSVKGNFEPTWSKIYRNIITYCK